MLSGITEPNPITASVSIGNAPVARYAAARAWLSRCFCSEEVDADPRLKIICGSLLLYFHMTFVYWSDRSTSLSTLGDEVFNYAPWVFFQNFRWLIFLDPFQTRVYFYGLGMLALLGLFSLFYLRSSVLALCLLAFLWINKAFFYACDFRLFTNFHHFHLLYTLVFLISQDKLRFFRALLGLSYVMSGIVKLTPSWLFGEYFNSLPDKLPMFPKASWVVTSASVALTVLEILGPLVWLTSIRWLRRFTFGAFILFHLYSGVIVGFWYTTLMLPLVVAAFLKFDEPLLAGWRFTSRQAIPVGIFALALCGSVYHLFIPGDSRLTSEGRYFGLFMFDANRAVRFETRIEKGNKAWVVQVYRPPASQTDLAIGSPATRMRCLVYEHGRLTENFTVTRSIRDGGQVIFNPQYFTDARMRVFGDPYLYYYYGRELVRRYHPDLVSLSLEQQMNGHREFARLLDIEDFGRLNPSYNPFVHNAWITLPGADSPPEYRWP